jgi:hypothetical protein
MSSSPPETLNAPGVAGENPLVAATLSLARTSFESRNYRAAATYAESVLAMSPGQVDAVRIQEESRTALAHFDEAIAEVREHLARGNAQAAAGSLETARAIDPTSPTLAELASRIQDASRQRASIVREPSTRVPPPPSKERAPAQSPPVPTTSPTTTTGGTPVAPPSVPEPLTPAPVRSEPPPTPPAPASPGPPAAPGLPESTPGVPSTAPPRAAETARPDTARAPEPPRQGPSQGEIDDAAIRRVVATYGRAIETKDLALFRSIKPNLSPDEERRLQQGFRAVTSQRVTLTVTSIDRQGDSAAVVVQRRDVLDVGGRRQTVEARQSLTLTRAGVGWVIAEIR